MTGNQHKWTWALIVALALASAYIAFAPAKMWPHAKVWYGLDIQGGVRMVLQAQTNEYRGKWDDAKLELVRKIIENRVNAQGVSEPTIITKPPDQIIIELPGLKNPDEARKQIQSTASLMFYLLPELGNSKDTSRPATWEIRHTEDPKTGGKIDALYDKATGKELTPEQLDAAIFDNKDRTPVATGSEFLPNSAAQIQPSSSSPVIEFELNSKGSQNFEDATRANIGAFLAIFLDKKLLTAPTINSVIPGKGIIEGNFTLESAKALSDQLNAGALPVPLKEIETRKLEATLGKEAVRQTTFAGAVGLGLVLLFMIFRYRLPGILADIALVLYALFSLALFKIIPITLTLPGIAGFILSIGMAVDANILIFERTKEELRSGKTLRAAIDAGFKRAFTAIFDSNVCTILTCGVLFNFGTGPIRGFALTLGIGVLVSMFTAITVSRTFLFSLVGKEWAQKPELYGVSADFKLREYHVMSRKFLWLGISGIVIIPGMIAWAMGGIKESIDFRGGTEIQVPFADRHSADQIKNAVASVGSRYKDNRVVVSEDPNQAVKHLASVTTVRLSDEERNQIMAEFAKRGWALEPGQGVGYSNVSGTISKELTLNAVYAVFVASILIVLFLALRFAIGGFVEGLKYGTCAVIALLHDVLVVFGVFAILGKLFNWEVDSLFVTAMLTVIGFSVHDTIIIFDRMRENLAHRAKGETFSDLADRSIDQTIARSINTSFTVVLTLTSLFLFGGAIVHQFTGALLVGIISGTYSSIFNASVLLVLWKQRDASNMPVAPVGGAAAKIPPSARPTALPGDRPLVTPSAPKSQPKAERPDDAIGADDAPSRPSPTTPRRPPPTRRRRM